MHDLLSPLVHTIHLTISSKLLNTVFSFASEFWEERQTLKLMLVLQEYGSKQYSADGRCQKDLEVTKLEILP